MTGNTGNDTKGGLKLNSRDTLIWLNSINGITNKSIDKLCKYHGNLENIWLSSAKDIANIPCVSDKVKNQIMKYRDKTYLENIIEDSIKKNVDIVTIVDEEFPERLKYIYDCPKVIYSKGEKLKKKEENILAIVGSRKATAYGQYITNKLTNELLELGITPISGMAKGVDTEVHLASIKKDKRNIAVLGCGVDIVYPKSNKYIYEKIIANGSVISEFPIGTEPLRYNFPQRNRIISGLSQGVIVVEANEKSGSLITAHHAAEQGKEVFAVPGNINSIYSRGTNLLIKDGAKIVLGIDDIIEEIKEFENIKTKANKRKTDYGNLSKDEMKIVSCIESEPMHTDLICLKTNISISNANSILTILEMKGIVRKLPNQLFTIR